MKPSRSVPIIAAMAVVIAALSWALVYYARDEFKLAAERRDIDIPAHAAITSDDGFAVVHVSPQSQNASGITTAALGGARAAATLEVAGVVLNPQPLLDLRGRYLAAAAEANALRTASANSKADYDRLRGLFDDERNVSERALLAAETQWQGDQARATAAQQAAATLLDDIRINWGMQAARWVSEGNTTAFDALAKRRAALLMMTLPYERQADADPTILTVAPDSSHAGQRPVRFVSAAPQADTLLSGATYLYLAENLDLRSGIRLTGQMKRAGKPRDGVVVPATAAVWHGGKAWAYVKDGDERFVRKPLATDQEMNDGWFAGEGFVPGDQVVVGGAQLLLSEELKFQIRNENED